MSKKQPPKKLPPVFAWPEPRAGMPYGPSSMQAQLFINDMPEESRPHHHELDITLMVGGAGSGKCLRTGTLVILQTGELRKVEDIVVGDLLLGPDSTPRKVLSLGKGVETFYKVTPVKGDPFYCNESHILSLKKSGSDNETRVRADGSIYHKPPRYGYRDGEVCNVSVREYLTWSARQQQAFKLYRSEAVTFDQSAYLPIDSYILGLWLGDGDSSRMTLTTMDSELLDVFIEFSTKHGMEYRLEDCPSKAVRVCIKGATSILRDLDVLDNKHIPDIYKTSSIEDRLQVLAGLIDSDGYKGDNYYEITQKSNKLAEDILYLCRSLGLAAYSTKCLKSCTTSAGKFTGEYNRITISGDLDRVPVLLKRKKATPRKQKKDHLVTGFTLEKLPPEEYHGFTIDGDHLFLLGDFTVVHNTAASIANMVTTVCAHSKCKAIVGGKNFPLLRRNVVPEFGARFSYSENPDMVGEEWGHPVVLKKPTINEMLAKFVNGASLQFLNLDKYLVARGFDADAVMIEEVNLMDANSFDEMIRRSRGKVLPVRQFILSMNPSGERDWIFYKFNMRQFEPEYDGPPLTIGDPCKCHLCQRCLNERKIEVPWVDGVTKYKKGENGEDILYHRSGSICTTCGAKKGNSCPGNQYYYRVIRSRSYDNLHNPDSYVQDMIGNMDPLQAKMFVEGAILQLNEGKCYKAFSSQNMLTDSIPLNEEKDLVWTHDFNADPMCSVVWQETDWGVHVVDELILWNSNEEQVAKAFCEKYKGFKKKVLIYGDPTSLWGESRKETKRTSYQILYDYLTQQGFDVEIRMEKIKGKTIIPIRDRINNTNAMLKNAYGEIRIKINPHCEHLRNSLASVCWDKAGKEEDKNVDEAAKHNTSKHKIAPIMSHPACAFGYSISKCFDMIKEKKPQFFVVSEEGMVITNEKGSPPEIRSVVEEKKEEPKVKPIIDNLNEDSLLLSKDYLKERLDKEKEDKQSKDDNLWEKIKKFLS